jgi:hypothetical protein
MLGSRTAGRRRSSSSREADSGQCKREDRGKAERVPIHEHFSSDAAGLHLQPFSQVLGTHVALGGASAHFQKRLLGVNLKFVVELGRSLRPPSLNSIRSLEFGANGFTHSLLLAKRPERILQRFDAGESQGRLSCGNAAKLFGQA